MGQVVCDACSQARELVPEYHPEQPQRVCRHCIAPAAVPAREKPEEVARRAPASTPGAASLAVPAEDEHGFARLEVRVLEVRGLAESSDLSCLLRLGEVEARRPVRGLRWDVTTSFNLSKADSVLRLEVWREDARAAFLELPLMRVPTGVLRGWVPLRQAEQPRGAGAVLLEVRMEELRPLRRLRAFVAPRMVASPSRKDVEALARAMSPLLLGILDLMCWTSPLRSLLALLLWNLGAGLCSEHYPSLLPLAVLLFLLCGRSEDGRTPELQEDPESPVRQLCVTLHHIFDPEGPRGLVAVAMLLLAISVEVLRGQLLMLSGSLLLAWPLLPALSGLAVYLASLRGGQPKDWEMRPDVVEDWLPAEAVPSRPSGSEEQASPGTGSASSTEVADEAVPSFAQPESGSEEVPRDPLMVTPLGVSLAQIRRAMRAEPFWYCGYLRASRKCRDVKKYRWSSGGTGLECGVRSILPLPDIPLPKLLARSLKVPVETSFSTAVRMTGADNEDLEGTDEPVVLVLQSCSHDAPYGEYFRIQETLIFAKGAQGTELKRWVSVLWVKSLPWALAALRSIIESQTVTDSQKGHADLVRCIVQAAEDA